MRLEKRTNFDKYIPILENSFTLSRRNKKYPLLLQSYPHLISSISNHYYLILKRGDLFLLLIISINLSLS